MSSVLDTCVRALSGQPDVISIERSGVGHLVTRMQIEERTLDLAIVDRGEGWASMVALIEQAPAGGRLDPILLSNSLEMSEDTGVCRFLLADGGLWLRTDCLAYPALIRDHARRLGLALLGLSQGDTAGAFLIHDDVENDHTAVAALLAASGVANTPVAAIQGWRVDDPDDTARRPIIIRWAPAAGGLMMYLGVHQMQTNAPAESVVETLLHLNDQTQLGRCVLLEGLGLTLMAASPLAGLNGERLRTMLTRLWMDASLVMQILAPDPGDLAEKLALMERWLKARQAEAEWSDAAMATAVLASARGQPVADHFADDPMVRRVIGELGVLLLAELPRRHPQAIVLLMMGLELTASGSRAFDEIWDLARSYAETPPQEP
ncbi:MAG: hypothetical protein AAFV53_25075 [Myxococcota bacterium]